MSTFAPPPPPPAPPAPIGRGIHVAGTVLAALGLIFGLIPFTFIVAWACGATAVVLGLMAWRRARPAGVHQGRFAVAGGLAAVALGIVGVAIIATAVDDASDEPTAKVAGTVDRPPTSAPPTGEPAPATTAENPEVAGARDKAQQYLDSMGFCRPALIQQLEYEGFSTPAATTAVDTLGIDWAAETVTVAKAYADSGSFSHEGLVEQLNFEGCDPAHSEAAATAVLGY